MGDIAGLLGWGAKLLGMRMGKQAFQTGVGGESLEDVNRL